MESNKTTLIEVVEAAYSLDGEGSKWLPNLLSAGAGVFDLGRGCAGSLWFGAANDGQPRLGQMCSTDSLPEFQAAILRAAQAAGPGLIAACTQALAGGVSTLSDIRADWPAAHSALTEHLGCEDMLTLFALDPDFYGACVSVPSKEELPLTSAMREKLKMLTVHMAAGARLVRHAHGLDVDGATLTEMPMNAEALLDPKKFVVSQASGDAQEKAASESIREAAVRVDKARGQLRNTDPDAALEMWQGLVRGRWSLVDWFDTDGRRFVLAKPNAPNIGDPRGLTEREHQVCTYAARGESSKFIAYRFGISAPRVSALLKSAMRKLGVKTQAQLVEHLSGFPVQSQNRGQNEANDEV